MPYAIAPPNELRTVVLRHERERISRHHRLLSRLVRNTGRNVRGAEQSWHAEVVAESLRLTLVGTERRVGGRLTGERVRDRGGEAGPACHEQPTSREGRRRSDHRTGAWFGRETHSSGA